MKWGELLLIWPFECLATRQRAMLPFCGYHMGDYWVYYQSLEKVAKVSALWHINSFRWSAERRFLWPGHG
jgi:phosphoenolpyruvate carboxykinase (GTP)